MKVLSLLLFTLYLTIGYGQIALHFEDDFNNNQHEWWLGETDWVKCEINSGRLKITNLSETGSNYLTNNFKVLKNDNFTISTSVRQIDGLDNQFMSLVWGDVTYKKNYYSLSVTSNKYYRVDHYIDGEFTELLPWTLWDELPGMHEWINLKITYNNKTSSCYVNERKVYETNSWEPLGKNIGFRYGKSVVMEATHLTAHITNRHINEVKDAQDYSDAERLPDIVNSNLKELSPNISPDGTRLNFIRRGYPHKTIDGKDADNTFWYSEIQNEQYSEPQLYSKPFNQFVNNTGASISPDGQTIIARGTMSNGSLTTGFSLSHKTQTGWGPLEKIDIPKFDEYAQGTSCFAFLAADGQTLLLDMSPEPDQRFNNIYVCFKKKNKWTEPLHLGPIINPPNSSTYTPFLAADGKTLYFSTNGHPGYGSSDIFMSRRLDDSWTNWSTPLNLGPKINDETWNAYFSIPASGDYAYFIADKNNTTKTDIYRIKMAQDIRPEPVLLVKGKVLNSKTLEPIHTNIVIHNLTTNEEVGVAQSNHLTGEYEIVLPSGGEYAFYAEQKNFYSVRESQLLQSLDTYTIFTQDLLLTPMKKGQQIQLNNIFFVRSKSVLLPASLPELNRLAEILQENPNLKIQIEGHTDNTGSAQGNLQLSQERADKIKSYLTDKGISKKRLSAKGYGQTKPLNKNLNEAEKRVNRRVEFIIL